MGREADTCSVDWIRRPDNLISCDVPIITTAFEQRQVAGSWEWGQVLGPAFQKRAPRLEEGRCVPEMKLSACMSFTFAPAEMYNYSQGPLSWIPLPHNSSSPRLGCSLHLLTFRKACCSVWHVADYYSAQSTSVLKYWGTTAWLEPTALLFVPALLWIITFISMVFTFSISTSQKTNWSLLQRPVI